MNDSSNIHLEKQFVATPALPCPYIPGQTERKLVTELVTKKAVDFYEELSQIGFRRSHGLAYKPICPNCNSCVPVRIRVGDFKWTRTFRRMMKQNVDLLSKDMVAHATIEQYNLFNRYQRFRHTGGEMATMAFRDFQAMVEHSPIETRIIEFRDIHEDLVGVMLADRQKDALSAVYSVFDPRIKKRGLGTYMVLWMVKRAEELKLSYIYLGYWVKESSKMSYKERFRPLEGFTTKGWKTLRNSA
ncbi:MAG: arginyltransferase [Pseudomonadota bacterium]|nr:arginyltransferase [Pseudomonadota bacterium]